MDEILSSIGRQPTSHLIYSSLSFFGREVGGELPGTWFVQALGTVGCSRGSVRQALFRGVACGELEARRQGRGKLYRPSVALLAALDAGREKLLGEPEGAWDGRWTLVHCRFEVGQRDLRDRIRDVLESEGFGLLGPGAYAHPRRRTDRILEAAASLDLLDRVTVFRADGPIGHSGKAFVDRLWDLDALADRYRAFERLFAPWKNRALTSREAFIIRFAVSQSFLEIAWSDPDLPTKLLPRAWPGAKTRRLARDLIRSLLPPAIEYARDILARVHPEPADSVGEDRAQGADP